MYSTWWCTVSHFPASIIKYMYSIGLEKGTGLGFWRISTNLQNLQTTCNFSISLWGDNSNKHLVLPSFSPLPFSNMYVSSYPTTLSHLNLNPPQLVYSMLCSVSGILILTHWRLVPSILRLRVYGKCVLYSKIKYSLQPVLKVKV